MPPRTPLRIPALTLTLALAVALFVAPAALAHIGGEPGSGGPWTPAPPSRDVEAPRGERPCDNALADWRPAQVVEGVFVRESLQCEPDDPRLVAAFVKGTNNMPQKLLDDTALHRDAVVKSDDRDGDGDPDVIHITLEVAELNGWHLEDDVLAEPYHIAPGVAPGFWVFHPKSTIHHSGPFHRIARPPTVPIRVEVNDTVRVTLENTHYFPHTIHLHGVDHPFLTPEGEGNDGVPHASERPVLPGEAKTYALRARQPGTMFYHCHVQPQVHVGMGLGALFIVEEDRPDNWLQTFNVGAGEVRHPSKAVLEAHDREYDLVYQDVDKELNEIITHENDPRVIAKAQNRGHDAAERDPDYFLLNGRSFPYTLRESVIVVDENESAKLRVVNAGTHPVSLHTHGHKATITHTDGVEAPPAARVQRDVYTLTAAQRLDLALNTTNDGLHSYGPGVWFMHDHQEEAVTTDGIGPGGDITVIAYREFLDEETAMPAPQAAGWEMFFNAAYYRGEIPVWNGLGMPGLLGEVDAGAAEVAGDGRAVPAPGALLAAAVACAALARARLRGVRP